MQSPLDERYMNLALALARRGLGITAPNPTVGCVIVQDGVIVGRGSTAKGGRPHAETIALKQAGKLARGATVYVTLEPCCHHGKTPPCTDALIEAGISRIVVATKDTNPVVAGKGIKQLEAAGISVAVDLGEKKAQEINAGFFNVHEQGRPLVTLKLATTLDGKIAMESGESKWITGESSRNYAHLLRAQHDAIMVGSNTVKADNPELNCRLPGFEGHSPVRVVVDSKLDIRPDAKLITHADSIPTWVITSREHIKGAFPESVKLHQVPSTNGQVDIKAALALLAKEGITRVLVEGGAKLAASLLKAGVVDRLVWFHAPCVIGKKGLSAVGDLEKNLLNEMPRFKRESVQPLGGDLVTYYTRL